MSYSLSMLQLLQGVQQHKNGPRDRMFMSNQGTYVVLTAQTSAEHHWRCVYSLSRLGTTATRHMHLSVCTSDLEHPIPMKRILSTALHEG